MKVICTENPNSNKAFTQGSLYLVVRDGNYKIETNSGKFCSLYTRELPKTFSCGGCEFEVTEA